MWITTCEAPRNCSILSACLLVDFGLPDLGRLLTLPVFWNFLHTADTVLCVGVSFAVRAI